MSRQQAVKEPKTRIEGLYDLGRTIHLCKLRNESTASVAEWAGKDTLALAEAFYAAESWLQFRAMMEDWTYEQVKEILGFVPILS